MKRVTSGVVVLGVLFGVTACATDYSLDFGGPPTQVQVNPTQLFIEDGATKAVLVRLINDRNQGVPASFTLSDVGAGITVRLDDQYRPDFIGSDTLKFDPIQEQHRYFITANAPNGTQTSFKLSNGNLSTTVTVRVLPSSVGTLSATAPAIGEVVTIAAPANLSFSQSSTVVFDSINGAAGSATTSNAVVTEVTAKSISFLPRPGSHGKAAVSGVTLDYAPTLAPRTIKTSNSITVPAVTSIPLNYSNAAPAAGTPVTVTATNFKFLPTASFTYGGTPAFVLSISADSSSAVILPPPGLAAANASVSGVVLSFLRTVTLNNVPATAAITTPAYPAAPAAPAGTTPANAPTFTAAAPGVGAFYAESGTLAFGPDVDYIGNVNDNHGGPRYYKLVVPSAGSRTIQLRWNGGGDMDLFVRNAANTANIASATTGNMPETVTANLAAGEYIIVLHDWHNDGPRPTQVLITVK